MPFDPALPFAERVRDLPWLGLGISTEFGARASGLDVLALRRARPDLVGFLELGIDLERGLDADARAWLAEGWPVTYHFLDLNLEDPDDLDPDFTSALRALAREVGAAWLCGDAGIWHIGPRDRGHGTLMPPVLTPGSTNAMARSIRALREQSDLEVLPENPPAHVYLGELHLLDYFARVADAADCGVLLDTAHLAIYQRVVGCAPETGLDGFPLERVVEIHVAGGREFTHAGRTFVDDDHSPEPLPEVWQILEAVLPRARNLRALVYECERNPAEKVIGNFERLARALASKALAGRSLAARPAVARAGQGSPAAALDPRDVQRALFRMQLDGDFADRLRAGEPEAAASTRLGPDELALLRGADPAGVSADLEGKRRRQLLRNLASELALCSSLGPDGDGDPAWIEAFPSSPEFHRAIAEAGSLPLAFASHAEAVAARATERGFRALAALEVALARLRRHRDGPPATLEPGEIALAPGSRLLALPAGTHAYATRLRQALDRGDAALPRPNREPSVRRRRQEWLLLAAGPAQGAFRLRSVRVELLQPAVAAFLELARRPLGATARASFARKHGLEDAQIESLVRELEGEGVLQVAHD